MKAVLVLDEMPRCCDECQLNYDMGVDCDALPMISKTPVDKRGMHNEEKRPSWCPLKEMPEKRILPSWQVNNTNYGEEPWFSDGWNACLEEIEK